MGLLLLQWIEDPDETSAEGGAINKKEEMKTFIPSYYERAGFPEQSFFKIVIYFTHQIWESAVAPLSSRAVRCRTG